ncbi:MAG: hypothetical protein JWR26_1214 [Pedosphaera sp.]|nr:hypothetical protein [Pedosphaera sp.]
MVDRIFKFFSSLRLTVVLLSAGLVLVFVGTLAQVHEGLYQAQVRYFRSWFIWQPTVGDSVWPILLPGGYLIGTMLLINLVAAHLKRFKLTTQKIGIQLIHGGIILLLLGQLLTDVLARESSMKLVEGTSKDYSEDFHANELVVIDKSNPQSDGVVSIPESLLASAKDIQDPALPVTLKIRDCWPNCEVNAIAPPGSIAPPADHGNFTNMLVYPIAASGQNPEDVQAAALVEVISPKGSLGTFLVPSKIDNSEVQTFAYGDHEWTLSMLFAPMIGGNQLAVSDVSDSSPEGMINFPEAELARKGELKRDGLPVTLSVKEFWPQCRLYHQLAPNSVQPRITRGGLVGTFVTPMARVTDPDHRDFPAAVVEIFNGPNSLGTWLLWTANSSDDIFLVGNKPLQLAFRHKRYYEPYRIGLVKFTHDKYKGTTTDKNFASRLRVINPQGNEDREVLIKMNSPLRYAGTTYYQGSFDPRDPHVSILQVVTNPSWLTPYLSCLLVMLGLIWQFGSHLIGFALKRRTT